MGEDQGITKPDTPNTCARQRKARQETCHCSSCLSCSASSSQQVLLKMRGPPRMDRSAAGAPTTIAAQTHAPGMFNPRLYGPAGRFVSSPVRATS